MKTTKQKTFEFRKKLETLSREDLLEIIKSQDTETIKQINRIEWVFENKLSHLAWADGSQVLSRPLTNRELSLLVDEPFEVDSALLNARTFFGATKTTSHSQRSMLVGKALFEHRNKSLSNINTKRSISEKSFESRKTSWKNFYNGGLSASLQLYAQRWPMPGRCSDEISRRTYIPRNSQTGNEE